MIDATRLAVGTLTAVRIRAPRTIDARVARRAMLMAPLVGLILGVVTESVVLFTRWLIPELNALFIAAAIAVVTLALLTRAIHLDGVADTADALGSGKSAAEALEVMKRSDIGAFGVVSLVLLLLVQVGSLYTALVLGRGTLALVGGVMVARLAMTWTCRRGIPAARESGLGASVAGSVPIFGAACVTVVVAIVLAAIVWHDDDIDYTFLLNTAVAILASLFVAGLFVRHCVRRFGGVTGDVMGAAGELAFAVFALLICVR